MGFTEAIRHNFSHYADFSGRAQRSQYWWWFLFVFIVQLVLGLIDSIFGLYIGGSTTAVMIGDTSVPIVSQGIGVLQSIWVLAVLIPNLAVIARRLHDTEHSAWWLLWIFLLTFVCFIGVIFWLVFMLQKGTPGPNKYGSDPLGQPPAV